MSRIRRYFFASRHKLRLNSSAYSNVDRARVLLYAFLPTLTQLNLAFLWERLDFYIAGIDTDNPSTKTELKERTLAKLPIRKRIIAVQQDYGTGTGSAEQY